MTPQELKARTTAFAYCTVRFTRPLLQDIDTRDIARQLRRAATAVAANYRAVCRARSDREFIAKVGVVLEEADEAEFWLEVIRDCAIATGAELSWLIKEAGELVRIFAASRRTVRERLRRETK
jgi:four helix bundle protein